MSPTAGAVAWAVVPFAPAAPFRLYAGTEQKPVQVDDVRTLLAANRKGGDTQFDYIVPGKARPVLLLTDAISDQFGEYLALRLARLSKFAEEERERIRAERHPTLFYLTPDQFSLEEEDAAMLAAPVRVHRSALDTEICGTLNQYELATVIERFVRLHRFDVRGLLRAAAAQAQEKP